MLGVIYRGVAAPLLAYGRQTAASLVVMHEGRKLGVKVGATLLSPIVRHSRYLIPGSLLSTPDAWQPRFLRTPWLVIRQSAVYLLRGELPRDYCSEPAYIACTHTIK